MTAIKPDEMGVTCKEPGKVKKVKGSLAVRGG